MATLKQEHTNIRYHRHNSPVPLGQTNIYNTEYQAWDKRERI